MVCEKAINIQATVLYLPSQNVIVERFDGAISELVRTTIIAKKWPTLPGVQAVSLANYPQNHAATRGLEGKTPEEARTGRYRTDSVPDRNVTIEGEHKDSSNHSITTTLTKLKKPAKFNYNTAPNDLLRPPQNPDYPSGVAPSSLSILQEGRKSRRTNFF
jgi:hypothetical protein